MIFELNDYEASIFEYNDIEKLMSALKKHYDFHVLLGGPSYNNKFMIVKFTLPGTNEKFGVGLAMYDIGVEPRIATVPYRNLSLIGYNQTLAILNLELKTILFKCEFVTPIVFFKCYPEGFLVLTENCIYLFSYYGEQLNKYVLDGLLMQFEFTNDALLFSTDANRGKKAISLKEFGINSMQ